MSKPQSKSSQAQKSAAKASQSSSKAHEVLENLLADNAAQKEHIKLLEAENQRLSYAVGGRDLEIHDLIEEIKDHENCVADLLTLSKQADDRIKYWEKENQRLVDQYNQLGRDYANLQTLNDSLCRLAKSS